MIFGGSSHLQPGLKPYLTIQVQCLTVLLSLSTVLLPVSYCNCCSGCSYDEMHGSGEEAGISVASFPGLKPGDEARISDEGDGR